MSFFEPPPPPPRKERSPRLPWHGPPDNYVGGAAAIELVLARSADAAVSIGGFVAYPTGFELTLRTRVREPLASPGADDPLFPWRGVRTGEAGVAPEMLRFGIQLSDGGKATNLAPQRAGVDPEEAPSGPVLWPQGGGGGNGRSDYRVWIHPLPPPGALTFVCEWPVHGIPETRREVDASVIREAAGRAQELWPEPTTEPGDGWWSSYGTATVGTE